MSAESVRRLLLRVLFDEEFHQLVITDPERAFSGYDLTDREREELTHPGASFYALLSPAGLLVLQGNISVRVASFPDPPPVTITTNTVTINTNTVTINTVTINITTTTINTVFNPYSFVVNDALQILGNTIRDAGDKERFTRILELLRLMTGERR